MRTPEQFAEELVIKLNSVVQAFIQDEELNMNYPDSDIFAIVLSSLPIFLANQLFVVSSGETDTALGILKLINSTVIEDIELLARKKETIDDERSESSADTTPEVRAGNEIPL